MTQTPLTPRYFYSDFRGGWCEERPSGFVRSVPASAVPARLLLAHRATTEDRFALHVLADRDRRGGLPTATVINGRIVFTYPDGSTKGDRT